MYVHILAMFDFEFYCYTLFIDMGRRKSKRKPPAKRKAIEPLDQQFNCPFCNHEKSCEVKM